LELILIDKAPPTIEIYSPIDKEIIEADNIVIYGQSSDNQAVQRVEVCLDEGEYMLANGTEFWSIIWDISTYSLGNHNISVKAFDDSLCVSYYNITFILNESGHSWAPVINDFYNKPENPTNESNVVIYANVTAGSPFTIDKIFLYWDDGIDTESTQMFRYGDNPIQDRHEEDPLKNESNEPVYGFELGQFATGKNISYWIEAFDAANNSIITNTKSFTIE